MAPKSKPKAKSGSVGPKPRSKASPEVRSSPEPGKIGAEKATPESATNSADQNKTGVDRAEILLRECIQPDDITVIDGRVLEIALLDGKSKGVDADLVVRAEKKLQDWHDFRAEILKKSEEMRIERENMLTRHEEENVLFSEACCARQRLKSRLVELFSAVEDSDLDKVKSWVDDCVASIPDSDYPLPPLPIDCEDHELNTPLSEACAYGEVEIASLLREHGANLDCMNSHGKTPLYRATYNGHDDVVRLLLDSGADPWAGDEEVGKYGTEKTKAMVSEWNADKFQVMREKLSTLQRLPEPWTRMVLRYIRKGDVDGVRGVLQSVSEATSPEETFATPLLRTVIDFENMADSLWIACTMGQTQIVSVLLEAKADVDSYTETGLTCLMIASRKGHASVVNALLNNGAKTYLRSELGLLATDYSREAGHALHDSIMNWCKKNKDWTVLDDDAQRSTGNKICGADAIDDILDNRTNITASNSATSSLKALPPEEIREGSDRYKELLEQRALADVLGFG